VVLHGYRRDGDALFFGQHQHGLQCPPGAGRAIEGHQDVTEHAVSVLAAALAADAIR
jgi:hypothetical protein